jgi:hypothetical protein
VHEFVCSFRTSRPDNPPLRRLRLNAPHHIILFSSLFSNQPTNQPTNATPTPFRTHRAAILEDPFVSPYIDDLTRNVRSQVVLKAVAPYTRVKLEYLATQAGLQRGELEELLVALILDGKVDGQIDQVGGVLQLARAESQGKKYESLQRWAEQAVALQHVVASRLAA